MFEDSLFDSGAGKPSRKAWPKLASFTIEVCAIGVLVLLPLIYTQALPKQLWTIVETPSPLPGHAPARVVDNQPQRPQARRDELDSALREPREIPRGISTEGDEPPNEVPPSIGDFVPGGAGEGVRNSVITAITRAVPPTVMKLGPPPKLRVSSGVAAGMLVYQVKPQYPPLAVQAHIQGTVVLQAVIGKDGTVGDLHLVSGHPMLAGAAIEAVKQWRYRPYLLNNEPVEVDTQINVNFTLGGGR